MSSQSIISLPPQLEMISRSIPLLEKNRAVQNSTIEAKRANLASYPQHISSSASSIMTSVNNEVKTLFKIAETTFPIKENQPLNLRISLQPTDLMKLVKVKLLDKFCVCIISRNREKCYE